MMTQSMNTEMATEERVQSDTLNLISEGELPPKNDDQFTPGQDVREESHGNEGTGQPSTDELSPIEQFEQSTQSFQAQHKEAGANQSHKKNRPAKHKGDGAAFNKERAHTETWKPTHPRQLDDGKTHINIDARAQTELGRMLTHVYKSTMVHPTFGPFNSIEGFWAYIRSNEDESRDRFRYVSGAMAKRESRIRDPRYIPNFHDIIIEANYYKIIQNEKIKKLFIESTLPFDSYYIFHSKESKATEGMLVRPQIFNWLIPGFNRIRTMIRDGLEYGKVNYGDLVSPQPATDADLNKLQSKFNRHSK